MAKRSDRDRFRDLLKDDQLLQVPAIALVDNSGNLKALTWDFESEPRYLLFS